ncbi:MAG: nucleoside hydrolase [Chthoniobacterales bacterium]
MNVRLLALAFAALAASTPATVSATHVWIDTDPAIGSPFREIDDGFALVLAFHSRELQIAGISTTYGNSSLATTTTVAEKLAREFGGVANVRSTDVYSGASSATDFGKQTSATEALASALRRRRLTYIALGPLTNLATFIRLHPFLISRIDRIIFLGGKTDSNSIALGRKHTIHIHDANVFKDTAALRAVIDSKIPLTIVPIAVASRLTLNSTDMQYLRASGPAGSYLYDNARAWLWFWTRIVGNEGGPVFDALAVVAATRPEMITTEVREAAISAQGELIASKLLHAQRRVVRWCRDFNPDAKTVLLERLARRGGKPSTVTSGR